MIAELWQQIEAFLEAHAPDVFGDLRPPASELLLQHLEAQVGRSLPEEVRQTYLLHDGQEGSAQGVFEEWDFLKIDYVVVENRSLSEMLARGAFDAAPGYAIGPVKLVWWDMAWVPVLSNGGGDLLCVDLAPEPGGNYGQVVEFTHDSEYRHVVAGGLGDWLSVFARRLGS